LKFLAGSIALYSDIIWVPHQTPFFSCLQNIFDYDWLDWIYVYLSMLCFSKLLLIGLCLLVHQRHHIFSLDFRDVVDL
jgi:hypothetical protein